MENSAPNPCSFVLLSCESQGRDEGGDKSLERAFQSLSLKQRLEAIQTAVARDDAKVAFLPGSGAVYMSGCKYAVVEDRWMAIFVGEVENYSYLVKKYCLAEAGLDPQGQYLLETVRALSPLNDAQVVALLFKKLGPTFMSKLRGVFTFAVYDSNVGRVLVANDCNGSNSLWQGHVDDCLVVACNLEVVPTVQIAERTAIRAGEYKFGWRAAPIAYMASQEAVHSRSNEAMQAAMAALASASVPLTTSASGSIPLATSAPVLDRRVSKTMPRPSPSHTTSWMPNGAGASSANSAGGWHTGHVTSSPGSSQPGGSYVPPHRRSQQFGPSHATYAPAAGKRGLSRNSTSSVHGTWRRSTSDATCRPPPKMSYRPPSGTLRRPSVPGAGGPVGDEPDVARPVSSLPARSDRLRDAMRLADEEDEEDFVATTMDAWRLAASSMLFQPAKVEARTQSSPQSMPQQQPQPSETSRDSDMVVDTCPSCRSNPIPIRSSLGSRPSTDQQTTDLADTSTLGNDGPILVQQKEIQSSLESVLCSSDSSATGTQQEVPPLDNKSSMQFPWCESESSFGTRSTMQDQSVDRRSQLGPAYANESDGPVYDSMTQPPASPAYIPAASSPQCLEAKHLLELTARECCEGLPDAPFTTASAADSFGTQDKVAAQHVDSPSAPHGHWSMVEPPQQQQRAPCMTSSGSFSDALALLLRSRTSSRNGAPTAETDAIPRSGLSVSTLAAALAPSNEPSQEGAGDDSSCQGADSTPQTAAQPQLFQGAPSRGQKIPEVSEDPRRSVNAGVAWQFGDRIIPASLLSELAGGSEAVEEQAALASLVYSSPCGVCIVDVRESHHPIVYVNLLFTKQTGYTAEEVLGRNCRFLQARPSGKRAPSVTSVAIYRAIQLGRSYSGKLLNFHKDGTPLWNQISLVPVRTKSLEVTHYIGMQSFTKTEAHIPAVAAQAGTLMRGSSHQCLVNLYDRDMGAVKLGKKSSSHVQLTALNPELASTASASVCGA